MKTIKKIMINLIMLAGIVMVGISAVNYYNIKQQQIKAAQGYELTSQEEPTIVEDPVFTSVETIPEPKNAADKECFKRKDYKNGMMIISIPKLKVEASVVKGTTIVDLKIGPGLYENSVLPDTDGGNVCIAAHRTTYGKWFRHVDLLVQGDDIELSFNSNRYKYKVENVFIVNKDDWSVTKSVGYTALTLTSCHPVGSDKQRIIVRAKLTEVIKQ